MGRVSGCILLLINILIVFPSAGQIYLLNEDFSSASGTTPPAGWSNFDSTGLNPSDLWQFDNPSGLPVVFPLSGKCATFDSRSFSAGGGRERPVSKLLPLTVL